MLFQLDHLLILICFPSKKSKHRSCSSFVSLFFHPASKTRDSALVTTAHSKLIRLILQILIAPLAVFLTMNMSKIRNSAPDSKHVLWIRQSHDSATFLVSKWFCGNFSPLHLFFSHFRQRTFALSRQHARTITESYTLFYSNNLLLRFPPSELWIISRK